MKTSKNIYCVCYNTLDVFTSKENAERFYTTCYYSSEGAERERYASIIMCLTYSNIALDGVDFAVYRIIYFNDKNENIKEIKIDWMNYKKAIEQIESEAADDN